MPYADIAGYTYRADTYCPACIIGALPVMITPAPAEGAESNLNLAATMLKIDRMDEYSYDSDDFPKVVFASQIEEYEYCAACGGELA